MRSLFSIPIISFLLLQSCGEKKEMKQEVKHQSLSSNPAAFSFELLMFDTINKTDGRGLKQGKWIIRKLPGHTVIEAGMYKDNQKQGYWIRNSIKGEFVDSIFYEGDEPKK